MQNGTGSMGWALRAPAATGFVVSPAYDGAFFILSPLLALALIGALGSWAWVYEPGVFLGGSQQRITVFITIWTYAHLYAVLFRSHGNPEIFRRHPLRFVAVPIALYALLLVSMQALLAAIFVAALWDIYHTSMQNFGFCRIYDSKLGNPSDEGRLLDVWLNHCIYIGPIFWGSNLIPSLGTALGGYIGEGWEGPVQFLRAVQEHQQAIRLGVLGLCSAFLGYYVFAYGRLVRRGYRISPQKLVLLGSVATASIWAWGFLPPLEAFFVANFFHGLQYFAIVWSSERKHIVQRVGSTERASSRWLGLALFAATLALLGMSFRAGSLSDLRWAYSIGLVISLMHFWYDGFIWSVRRGEAG